MFFRTMAAAAALTLTATPVVAQSVAADAQRSTAPVEEKSELAGGSGILAALAAVAVGAGIYFVVDDSEDEISG